MVKCGKCNRELKMINNAHLKSHGLTSEEYDTLYPDFPRYDSYARRRMGTKTNVNHNLFKELDYKSSWLLGLLTADGSFGGKTHPNLFQIYSTEKGLIDEFQSMTGTLRKITERQGLKGQLGKKIVYQLQANSVTVIERMKELNAWGDKDTRNPFANIPDQYKWSFIKGLFDGDGNCYKGHFSIAGRKQLTTEVYHWICKQLEKEPNKLYQSTASKKTIYFQMGKKDAGKVLIFMEEHAKGTYNSEKYNKLKNLHKATLGQLEYLAKHTEGYRADALAEMDKRMGRN